MKHRTAWRGVRRLLAFQTGLMLVIAVICGIFFQDQATFWTAFGSAVLAGVCFILTTAVFAVIAFKHTGAQSAVQIARAFYRAECMKWFLTAGLMAIIFVFIPIKPLPFFVTFCIMPLSFWAAPRLFIK